MQQGKSTKKKEAPTSEDNNCNVEISNKDIKSHVHRGKSNVQQTQASMTIDHLIILPCHSIWQPVSEQSVGDSREEWSLASFQVEGYDHLCFKEHITKSIELTTQDTNTQLIISGGQTKGECGPVAESQSYYQLARRLFKSVGSEDDQFWQRVSTEEFARDSFENVIFSICRFFELHGYYPTTITVVGFEFKKNRFWQHHLMQGLKWHQGIHYIGNRPDPRDSTDKRAYFEDLDQCEDKFAVQLFEKDWYGCKGKLLQKKAQRNPFKRCHGYATSNRKLSQFLEAISDDGDKTLTNEAIGSLLSEAPWVANQWSQQSLER